MLCTAERPCQKHNPGDFIYKNGWLRIPMQYHMLWTASLQLCRLRPEVFLSPLKPPQLPSLASSLFNHMSDTDILHNMYRYISHFSDVYFVHRSLKRVRSFSENLIKLCVCTSLPHPRNKVWFCLNSIYSIVAWRPTIQLVDESRAQHFHIHNFPASLLAGSIAQTFSVPTSIAHSVVGQISSYVALATASSFRVLPHPVRISLTRCETNPRERKLGRNPATRG